MDKPSNLSLSIAGNCYTCLFSLPSLPVKNLVSALPITKIFLCSLKLTKPYL